MGYMMGKLTVTLLNGAASAANLIVNASASAPAAGVVNTGHAVIAAGAALAAGVFIYINRHRKSRGSYEQG